MPSAAEHMLNTVKALGSTLSTKKGEKLAGREGKEIDILWYLKWVSFIKNPTTRLGYTVNCLKKIRNNVKHNGPCI